MLAMAVEAILTLLSWIPEEKEFETVVAEARVELLAVTATEHGLTVTSLTARLQQILKTKVDKPGWIAVVQAVMEALDCVKHSLKPMTSGTADDAVKGALELATSCTGSAVAAAGKALKAGTGEVASIVAGARASLALVHQIGQGIGLGFTSGPLSSIDVQHVITTPTQPNTDQATIPTDTVPLPRDGESVFHTPPPAPYQYPPRPATSDELGIAKSFLCGLPGSGSASLSADGAWSASYELDPQLGQYTVDLFPVADTATMTQYLNGLPANCTFGPMKFTRDSTTYGEAGGLYAGTVTATGLPTTAMYLIYAKGYLVYIIDNAQNGSNTLTTAQQQLKSQALTYILRKADQVLNLGKALETQRPA
jgi:hypothetical protein